MKVASEPWLGSVRPKPVRILPPSSFSASRSYWALVANSLNIRMKGLLPTIECSVCRSLCRPRPLAARCSRITAMASWRAALAAHLRRPGEAQVAGLVGAACAPRPAAPPTPCAAGRWLSQSVRAYSRRWSKKRIVVVLRLQRLDLGLDEGVELGQVVGEVLGQVEVHGRVSSQCSWAGLTLREAFTSRRNARQIAARLDQA